MIGMSMKVLVADSLAPVVDVAFALPEPSFTDAWISLPGVFAAAVFRLCRLQRHGHWYWSDVGVPFSGELQSALPGAQYSRFLAALALVVVQLDT